MKCHRFVRASNSAVCLARTIKRLGLTATITELTLDYRSTLERSQPFDRPVEGKLDTTVFEQHIAFSHRALQLARQSQGSPNALGRRIKLPCLATQSGNLDQRIYLALSITRGSMTSNRFFVIIASPSEIA